ncbi:tetratricopeptide repeat protein [Roseobacter sp. HKCCA0434]|uniref:tetratricopeptide repeat protein n=1 Tax=Roseobacter sp. HKCCA0434 TaxID=3079297 RepID=UPI002905B206|nr:tetratricopeptide repeat protein [Roseobacter sp. HKCCA0434]
MKRIAIVAAALLLTACDRTGEEALQGVSLNAIDELNLTQLMLQTGEPEAAVEFFRASLQEQPDRVDFQRGYAISLTRAGRVDEAIIAFRELDEAGDLEPADRLPYARALIRTGDFDTAEAQLTLVGDGRNSYDWNLLNALISDNYERWDEADGFYARARALTAQPGAVLNNWGVSKMSRGDHEGATRHFTEAVRYDPDDFSAKNNLALSRALRGNYAVPVVPLTEEERAQIYHNMALIALRRDDTDIARGLLELAVETHPRYFEAAARKLEALQGAVNR